MGKTSRISEKKKTAGKWVFMIPSPVDYKPAHPLLVQAAVICVSCFLSLTACTVLTVNGLQQHARTGELRQKTEDQISKGEWNDAAATVNMLKGETENDPSTEGLVRQIRDGLRKAAEERVLAFDYRQAFLLLGKAQSLVPDQATAARIAEVESTLTVPKVFANGLPLNSVFYRGGLPWDRSFSLIQENSNPAIESGFRPGSVIRLKFVSPFDLERLVFRLLSANQKAICAGEGFFIKEKNGDFTWFCFLGLPCTLKEEVMILSFQATRKGGETFNFSQSFIPKRRVFPEETVKLSSSLTTLLTVPDKRKSEERKLVAGILGSFDPKAFFQAGAFTQPVAQGQDIITSYYGLRRIFLYSSGAKSFSVHDGIDLGVKKGTPVLALGRGLVRLAREHVVSGNTVIIEHLPGVFSACYHMSVLRVREGDTVEQGQVVGEVGSTGLSTAPHLHFSVFVGSVAVDPAYFMAMAPIY
jgi:murein DD-endopeptidase MepM/ murein hydrolase activator NlpD